MNRLLLSTSTALALLLLPSLGAAQTQWTVDDNGPADFADLQLAIDTAAPGDVLLIQPGSYGSAMLTKPLSLLGDPSELRPDIKDVLILEATRFDLTHVKFNTLKVKSVKERSQINDCVQDALFGAFDSVEIGDAAELVVQASSFSALATTGTAPDRVIVSGDSRVTFVDCTLRGGNGFVLTATGEPGYGGNGLTVEGTSYVTVAGCHVRGGDGQSVPGDVFGGGRGGHGIETFDAAECDVRGSSFHEIEGGEGDADGLGFNIDGNSLTNNSSGALRRSGVTLVNGTGPGVTWVLPPTPYLYLRGDNQPSGAMRLFFYGDGVGAPGVVFTSFQPALVELPILFGIEAWLDPSLINEVLPFSMQGQDTAVNWNWVLPANPALAGFNYHIQGATVAFGPDGYVGANSAAIVLAF